MALPGPAEEFSLGTGTVRHRDKHCSSTLFRCDESRGGRERSKAVGGAREARYSCGDLEPRGEEAGVFTGRPHHSWVENCPHFLPPLSQAKKRKCHRSEVVTATGRGRTAIASATGG